MEAYNFLRKKYFISPEKSLNEFSTPTFADWDSLVKLLEEYSFQYGMPDEENEYEKRIAAEKLEQWEQEQNESNLLDAQVSGDLGGRNCSTCKNWAAYTTGMDEYPQCTGIAYCKKEHWENGKPDDDYTKCFIDCVDWEKNDSPNSR